jgi:formamidopyrimidine-DNA glycosylase
MPELPEVETTRRGIAAYSLDKTIRAVIVRESRLRWPIADDLDQQLCETTFSSIKRRGKYLLFQNANGTLIAHLGMSGSMRIVDTTTPAQKHDHVDIVFADDCVLRFNDPRRFGALVWTSDAPEAHKLLQHLGPEPLSGEFTAEYLFTKAQKRKQAVKQYIMDAHVVVGVGNIYAAESLHMAGIHPGRAASRISLPRYEKLVAHIKTVLARSIKQGGTTLRDFVNSDGKPGYFKQQLLVYGRAGEACKHCTATLRDIPLGGRASVYCPQCQR